MANTMCAERVIHWDPVVLNVLHDQFLALSQLEWSKRISLADDRDDIDARRETAHELDVQLTETVACLHKCQHSRKAPPYLITRTSRLHKVEQHMHPVIPKSRIALNPTLLRQNIIVLPLQVTGDFTKARLIVHTVTESWSVHNRQADPRAFLIELQLHGHGLDLDAWLASAFAIEVGRSIRVEMREDALLAEGVDEGGAACA